MDNIEKELELIKKRNHSVELDKAWEKSWTRRIFIAGLTYIIALIWMKNIGENLIFLKLDFNLAQDATLEDFDQLLEVIKREYEKIQTTKQQQKNANNVRGFGKSAALNTKSMVV